MLRIIILSCKKVSQNEGRFSPPLEGQDACHCVYALVQHGLLLLSFLLILDLLHPHDHFALEMVVVLAPRPYCLFKVIELLLKLLDVLVLFKFDRPQLQDLLL